MAERRKKAKKDLVTSLTSLVQEAKQVVPTVESSNLDIETSLCRLYPSGNNNANNRNMGEVSTSVIVDKNNSNSSN